MIRVTSEISCRANFCSVVQVYFDAISLLCNNNKKKTGYFFTIDIAFVLLYYKIRTPGFFTVVRRLSEALVDVLLGLYFDITGQEWSKVRNSLHLFEYRAFSRAWATWNRPMNWKIRRWYIYYNPETWGTLRIRTDWSCRDLRLDS